MGCGTGSSLVREDKRRVDDVAVVQAESLEIIVQGVALEGGGK
jgi:hypothetical protein